jgi:membrane protease YdiL (CAAX protease family)
MKKCPYCGREYSDDVTRCALDDYELPSNDSPQLATAEKQSAETALKKDEPYLTFPDYQWSAMDAWKCIGTLLLLVIILIGINRWLYLFFPFFWRSGLGGFWRSVLHYGVELLAVAYFARTETLVTFWKGFGLDRKPTRYVCYGLLAALMIRIFGHFMSVHGWGNYVHNSDLASFRNTIGFERYFYLIPLVILAPFCEEIIYRAFLYKAFRASYSIVVSMVLIVAWTCNTHWGQYSHSWVAALDLSALAVVQCYLREKSASLWDCIISHFAFNTSLLFISPLLQ